MNHRAAARSIVPVLLVMLGLGASAAPHAQAPAKIDVSGVWAFEVQTENGTGTPQVTFKQDGEKLTGNYSSAMLGEAELTGTIKGADIQFAVAANLQGNAVTLTFSGTVTDAATMKGKVDLAGLAEGTFTGKRK